MVLGYHIDCPCFHLSICPFVCLSFICPSVFSFPDDNLSKYQWIFTKLGMCIDIVEIWFGIANGQISSIFDSYLPMTFPYFCFRMITWVNINGFSPNLVRALILCGRPRWLSWMRRPTVDQEVAGSTPAEVGNILSWRLIMKYFLRSFSPFRWFKKGSCQFQAKECAQYWLTVRGLSLPSKHVVK